MRQMELIMNLDGSFKPPTQHTAKSTVSNLPSSLSYFERPEAGRRPHKNCLSFCQPREARKWNKDKRESFMMGTEGGGYGAVFNTQRCQMAEVLPSTF